MANSNLTPNTHELGDPQQHIWKLPTGQLLRWVIDNHEILPLSDMITIYSFHMQLERI